MQTFKYSAYFFFSVGYFGFVLTLFPLYLKDLGFNPPEIALLSGTATIATIFGGPSIISISQKYLAARPFTLSLFFLALLCHIGLFYTESLWVVLALCLSSQLCRAGGDSLVTAQALRDSIRRTIIFERVRLWGSIGYIVIALGMGPIVEAFGTRTVLWCGLAILGATFITALALSSYLPTIPGKLLWKDNGNESEPNSESIFTHRYFVTLLIASALLWASHGVLYAYLSVYLSELGWNTTLISVAWNIGVLSEILFLLAFPWIEGRISLVKLLALTILITSARWLILYETTSTAAILSSQLLHAFTFGACYICSLRLCFILLPDHHRDQGQAFVSAIGPGLGGLMGRGLAGFGAWWIGSFSNLNKLFLPAAFVALLAFAFIGSIDRGVKLMSEKGE